MSAQERPGRPGAARAESAAPGAVLIPFLRELNDAQREAVQHVEGPLLVIAGPGSGKTRVLTYRVAYLIAAGAAAPDGILAVTFTNKAASQMYQRLRNLVGPLLADRAWVGTFHATCVQILRREAAHAGIPRDFAIYDAPDQVQVMRRALKELDVDPKRYDPRALLAECSRYKNQATGPDEAAERASSAYDRLVVRAYRRYQELLREAKALDFDDLLLEVVRLFRTNAQALERYQQRFRFILVDEYQDTNHVQYLLVKALASRHRNVMVVGDEMQSIYGWRGADIRNILSFERDFPDAKVVRLEQNYRSTRTIVEAANHLIRHNTERLDKKLWTQNPDGPAIVLCRAEDERAEAAFVTHEILRRTKQGRPLSDFSILYRTHAQSRTFEEAFLANRVPYRIVAGLRFYERREIKDVLAYLRVIQSPHDVLSLRRAVNVPRRGVGEATLSRLEELAAEMKLPVADAIEPAVQAGVIKGPAARSLREFASMVGRLRAAFAEMPLTEAVARLLRESGYQAMLEQEGTDEALGRIENLKEFLSLAKRFEDDNAPATLDGFLTHVALVSDVDAYEEDAAAVTMMTLHAAKGLEFPVVFLVGVEEGILPHGRSTFEASDLEEERRLCYVGVTRARNQLYLTCARLRAMWGQVVANEVSRFVDEMPKERIEDVSRTWNAAMARDDLALRPPGAMERQGGWEERRDGGEATSPAPVRDAARADVDWRPGDRLRHSTFGEGTVVSVEKVGRDNILTAAFPGGGVRRLMASVAPIERL